MQTARQSVFFLKSVKKSVKRGVRVLRAPTARVFSLVPHLLFDCSRVLEYAKIRTVLQSNNYQTNGCLTDNVKFPPNELGNFPTKFGAKFTTLVQISRLD